MVIGLATGLLGLGLALPTGLAFGYGYGYGVRQGYSAFKVPGKTAMGLKQSPDPIKGSLGMGLQVAEERTNTIGLGRPSIQSAEPVIMNKPPAGNLNEKASNEYFRAEQERNRLIQIKNYAPKRYTNVGSRFKPVYSKSSSRRNR